MKKWVAREINLDSFNVFFRIYIPKCPYNYREEHKISK